MFPKQILLIASLFIAFGCATQSKKSDEKEPDQVSALKDQVSQLTATVAKLTDRLDSMDVKVSTVGDSVKTQLQQQQAALEQSAQKKKPLKSVATAPHPAENAGRKVSVPTSPHDPEAGLAHDEAVQRYRAAMVLFEGAKYSQSVLDLSSFVRDFADHPLAGAAQFYVGESYYKQGELKLAAEEYKRVLISYDRSSYLQDALTRLVQCYDGLKMPQEAQAQRTLLKSLFPSYNNLKDEASPPPITAQAPSAPAPVAPIVDEPPAAPLPESDKNAQPQTH